MPGKCLSAQTEGDKCCWRGHDKLATVNLRTRSPTGGLGVDTILYDCWMCLTALMKRINKKWEAPPSPTFPHRTHNTNTHIQLQPPLPFYCKLFDVPLFLLTVSFGFDQGLISCDISDTYYESNTNPHREAWHFWTLTVAERRADQDSGGNTSAFHPLATKKVNSSQRSHTSVIYV